MHHHGHSPKPPMTLLGIDPGLGTTGWGIIETQGSKLRYIASGSISPKASLPMEQRLHTLFSELSAILAQHSCHSAAIEETFVNSNARTSLTLGHARGALMVALATLAIPVHSYAPREIKKALVGTGRAEKLQIQMMVNHLLPTASVSQADEADALAVAICHAAYATLPKLNSL